MRQIEFSLSTVLQSFPLGLFIQRLNNLGKLINPALKLSDNLGTILIIWHKRQS